MREIYLDNAATTKPIPEVVEAVTYTLTKGYGNPSSLHKKGIEAEKIMKESSEYVAKLIGATKEEILYTSGGTESNNMAIIGTALAYSRRGKKIITTAIEHPSVRAVFDYLETQGFEVVILTVDEYGYINKEQLFEEINEETTLVSIMHVNNEVGTIQDLEEIGKMIKDKNPETVFHVDAIQSFGKLPINVRSQKIDLLTISGHKFYAPKGIGVLYKSNRVRIKPLIHGGGQQNDLRSGTQNLPGIAGVGAAAKYIHKNFDELNNHYLKCKTYLYNAIKENISDVALNGASLEEGAPHILNIAFKGIKSEVLLHALEQKEIYVSSGSACSSNKVNPKLPLHAMGRSKEDLDNAIRFSFNHENTIEDLDVVVEELKKHITMLRRLNIGGR